MADNSVFITGSASGSFTEAFSDLPPWATESTASEIERVLRRSLDVQSKTFDQLKECCAGGGKGKMSPEEVAKINDELDKLGRSLKRNNEEDIQSQKRRKDREKQEIEELENSQRLGEANAILQSTFTGLAALGTAVIGVNKDYIDVYDSLYRAGINVLNGNNSTADGFEALNQVVNLTGLRLQTLQKVAERYAASINASGFTKFARAISLSNTRLNELGFSSEAQAELIGTLLESEAGFMDIRRRSAQQISHDAIRFGRELDKLSRTVGVSREQLQENIRAEARSADTSLLYATRGEQATKNLLEATAALAPDLRKSLIEMAAVASPAAQSELYRKLTEAGMGDVAQQLTQIVGRGMAGGATEFNQAMEGFARNLRETGRIGQLAAIWDGTGKAGGEFAAAIMQYGGIITQATTEQEDNSRNTQASVARLQTEIESLTATAQKIFFPLTTQVDLAASALNTLNSSINGVIASIDAQIRSWIGIGVIVAGLLATLLISSKLLNSITVNLITTNGRLSGATRGIVGTVTGIGSALGRIGMLFLRLGGAVAAIYAAFQLGLTIGEVLREMITGVKGTVDYFGIVKDAVLNLGRSLMGVWETVSTFASDLGKTILEYVPWLSSVGNYLKRVIDSISSVVNEVVEFGRSYVYMLRTFVREVLSRFANRMTFGVFGRSGEAGASPEVVRPTRSPSEVVSAVSATTVAQTPAASPSPGTPSPVVPGLDRPTNNANINNLLSYQGAILEQLLISTNNLVSVNKDILRYTRTSA